MHALFHTEPAKLTPKDFVLYTGIMTTLYASVFSFILLLFQYINYLFPDDLAYNDPYSGTMRGTIATLLVIFPLYIALTRVTNQDIRKHPEKEELWFRKWLLYITLFIAGVAIIIDLIVLINGFLSGGLTTPFLLKILAVLFVVGGGFGYYALALRGYWKERERASKLYGVIVALVVLVSIVSGFFIMGSPQTQRLLKYDEQKISDLQEIQWQVIRYWEDTGEVPETLAELSDPLVFSVPNDPQTEEAYGYEKRGEQEFTLCATFNKATLENRRNTNVYFPLGGQFLEDTWVHPEGEYCFSRVINPKRFPVKEKMSFD